MSVYLDHNATSPLRPEVSRILRETAERRPGNPSSTHGFGQEAREVVDRARRMLRTVVGGPSGDLVFTGSGTEAVLLGVAGAAEAAAERGRHLVVSGIEHTAGLDAARMLEGRGWKVSRVAPDGSGWVDPDAVERAMLPETVLVSVMHANNETGVIQPVADIAARCRQRGVRYHVDAVQSVGKIPITVEAWGVDLLSLGAHKMGGPAGVGALWKQSGLPVRPVIPGTQEQGVRGGTHNVSVIAGFAEAARLAHDEREASCRALESLRRGLEDAVSRIPGARVTGADRRRLPNTTHLTLASSVGPDLVMALDLDGFAVSSGSACRAGSPDPSHVLLAMGMSPERARTAVRVSLGPGNTAPQLDGFVEALARRVDAVPGRSPQPSETRS